MTSASRLYRPTFMAALFAVAALACGAVSAAKDGPCPADTNASGDVNLEDLTAVILDWGCTDPPGPCAGDVNADAHVNVEDLVLVLLHWGPCPGAGVCDDPGETCFDAPCALECDGEECCAAACAAEAGLVLAAQMLAQEGARFIVTKGEVDAAYAEDLWLGTYDPADGDVVILPAQGYEGDPGVSSLVGALLDAHSQTSTPAPLPCPSDEALPQIDEYGTLRVQPLPLTPDAWNGPYFRLSYDLLEGLPFVRVSSQGVDGDAQRTLQMDFRIDKKIDYAMVSANRIMIGKNVLVEGALGTRFGTSADELDSVNGDPLMMRCDFHDLHEDLDAKVDVLYQQIVLYDMNGDNRLATDDPLESQGLIGHPDLVDADGDASVDDFDLFLAHYDGDNNGSVVYDSLLAGGMPEEFGADVQLARLIDESRPDRNGDGVIDAADTALGCHDGLLDVLDSYAKVRGHLAFGVTRQAWDDANGASYETLVQGPLRPESPGAAVACFEVSQAALPEITTAMVDSTSTWFHAQAQSGSPFGTYDPDSGTWSGQVGAQIASGGAYEAPGPTTWESMPYQSAGAYDFYQRAIFRNMTFVNVRIPKGTNALFEACTFIGVTYLETNEDCGHHNWNYVGTLEETAPGVYELRFPDMTAEYGEGIVVTDTRTESNNIRHHACTFLGSMSGDKPQEHTHWRNRVQFSGATRFYIAGDDPDLAAQADAAQLLALLSAMDPVERAELARSSIFLPGWSVHMAPFEPGTPKVKLTGTIVAGTLGACAAVDIHGTLLMTFHPVEKEGPLFYGGQSDAFKTTIGYLGPEEGDGFDPDHPDFPGFGAMTLRHDPLATLPNGIPWPIRVQPAP